MKTKAEETIRYIKTLNPNAPFCVVHLRRGDRLNQPFFSESSEVNFVVNTLQNHVEAGSSIYIMTNGTPEYVSELKSLLNVNFCTFTKEDFHELNELGTTDNFKLFAIESEMFFELSDRRFTNRNPTHNIKRNAYSLQQFWKESYVNSK